MTNEQLIEELRAELKNAHPAERRQIEAELAEALAERAKREAELNGEPLQ